MTVDKAIKELKNQLIGNIPEDYPDTAAAIRLGIEALKAIKLYREHKIGVTYRVLLGETE